MNSSLLNNNNGLTLTELVVGLGITSILVLAVISGSIFVQQYIGRWTGASKLLAEASFLQTEIKKVIETSREIYLNNDTLLCVLRDGQTRTYSWSDREFISEGVSFLRKGVKIDTIILISMALQKTDSGYIFKPKSNLEATGLYKLSLVLSEKGEHTDTITMFVENSHELLKLAQK